MDIEQMEQRARASLHFYFEAVRRISQEMDLPMKQVVRGHWRDVAPRELAHLIPTYLREPLIIPTPFGVLQYDPSAETAISPLRDGQMVRLRRTEGLILQELALDPFAIVSYQQLAAAVWEGSRGLPSKRDIDTLNTQVCRLRIRLGDRSLSRHGAKPIFRLIRTVYGIGYSLREAAI